MQMKRMFRRSLYMLFLYTFRETLSSILSKLQTSLFRINVPTIDWHTWGKWLFHGTKYNTDNHNHKNIKTENPAEYPEWEYKQYCKYMKIYLTLTRKN